MSRSKREIPHYYLSHQIDLTVADAFLRDANAEQPPEARVLMTALFAKSVANALAKFPEFNGHFEKDRFTASPSVHLGMAIHIRSGGLVAPALFDVQDKSLDAVMRALRDLVARVRAGRFRVRELSDATITLTSLGDLGVDGLYGVIYPPQVAIIGVGAPRMMPMVHEGAVAGRLACNLSLAADHRVSDGHRGALFLRAIDKNLQHPESLSA
jgi:pyruvate dehydrogenase E2 component (dihydrolipoamide acetyltransferase)